MHHQYRFFDTQCRHLAGYEMIRRCLRFLLQNVPVFGNNIVYIDMIPWHVLIVNHNA